MGSTLIWTCWIGMLCLLGWILPSPPVTQGASRPEAVTVTDALGRNVEIRLPLERIVTVNTSAAVIIRELGVDIAHKVVGVTDYIPQNPRFWPKLKDKPVIAYKNPNYERLAELNPQLVLFYATSRQFTQEGKLETLGITWLYLDCFNPETLAEDVRLLGTLFGKKQEAEKLIAWFLRYDRAIQSRLKGVPFSQRPRVFFFQYPDVNLSKGIYNTINRHASGQPLIAKAGGDNLAADLPMQSATVNAEWVVEKNPEVIIAGVLGKTFSGYNAEASTAERNLRGMAEQLAGDRALMGTGAIRNNRLLILSHDIMQGPSYVVGLAYIAKFLYPERLRDIMPEAIAKDYYETWCGLPYRGIFAYSTSKGIGNSDASK
jgi:iron complex transport system substrate-binding protein